jgi:hypothetical protein
MTSIAICCVRSVTSLFRYAIGLWALMHQSLLMLLGLNNAEARKTRRNSRVIFLRDIPPALQQSYTTYPSRHSQTAPR